MKRSHRAALFIFAVLLAATGYSEEWLDQSDLNKVKCLQERANASLANKPECYAQTRDGQFWEARRLELCSNPSQFCSSVSQLSDKDATSKLINSSCETIAFPKSLPQEVSAAKSEKDVDSVAMNRQLANSMRDYWGCSPGKPAGNSTSYTCSKLPCVKTTGAAAFSSTRMAELRQMYGVTAKPGVGGSCAIEIPAAPGGKPEERAMRFFVNSQAAMPGSDAKDMKDEALGPGEEKKKILRERARQMLKAFYTPARVKMLKKASEVAKRAMIKALDGVTPKPPKMIYEMVNQTRVMDNPAENAKDNGLLDEMIEICGLDQGFGLRTAAHTHGSTAHKGSHIIICPMNLLEAERNGSEVLVDTFSHEFGHAIGPCAVGQRLVAKAKDFRTAKGSCALPGKSHPDGGDFAFFNEQMRPFRACLYDNSLMSPAQTSAPECTFVSNAKLNTLEADYPKLEECQVNGKCTTVKSAAGEIVSTSCFQDGPQVRRRATLSSTRAGQLTPNERILFGLYMKAQIGSKLEGHRSCEFSETPSGDPCSCHDLAQHDSDEKKDLMPAAGSGLVSSCNKTSMSMTNPEIKEGLEGKIQPIDNARMQSDQSEEAMADYWGSLATGHAVQDPDYAYPNKSVRNSPDAVLDTVAVYATRCRMPNVLGDTHPHPSYRVTMYASDSKFRSYLGCSPTPPADSPQFPSAACSMSKKSP